MKRLILHWPDARLKGVAEPACVDEATFVLARDMFETMYAAQGRGLAAPQVGILTRVFVMDAGWKSGSAVPETFVNPHIIWRSEELIDSPEGCLSIPGVLAEVRRAKEIVLRWELMDGSISAQKLVGFRAICAQHEIDHLDGIVTLDHLSPEARAKAIAAMT